MVGTGLTKRARRRVRFSKPPTAEEMEAAKDAFKNLTFDRAVEDAEARAIEVLEAAGLRTDGVACVAEMQSQEWYADVIVSMVSRNRAAITRVAAGRGDEADDLARAALNLGYLICEARFKLEWEEDTQLGIKDRALRRKGAAAAKQARQKRDALIWALTEDYRKDGKRSAREIARHIKKRAVLESARSNEPGIDHKLWTSISKLSPDRIRRIVGEKVG